MARARNIKPGFFDNEALADLPPLTRLLFVGLWTLADRDGRLENRPKKIKAQLFAYEDADVVKMLFDLQNHGFIQCYKSEEVSLIQVVNWHKHQRPHVKEVPSTYPAPEKVVLRPEKPVSVVLIPDSLIPIPDSPISEKPVSADADEITDEMVDHIRKAHPRGTEDAADGRKAIVKAIKREQRAHGSNKNAARYLYKRVTVYRQKVSEWPPGEGKFGKMCATWFNKSSYSNPDTSYERKVTNGKSSEIKRAGTEAARLLGLPERSVAVLRANSGTDTVGLGCEDSGGEIDSRIIEGGIRVIRPEPKEPTPADPWSVDRPNKPSSG